MVSDAELANRIERHLNQEQRAKSFAFKHRKRLKMRQRMNGLLEQWGAWSIDSVSIKSSIQAIEDGGVYAQGHDHVLLTDFDSLMIQVRCAIERQNTIDRKLIEYCYQHEFDSPIDKWCCEFGRSPKTFKNKKSELLLKLALILKL